MSGPLLRLTIDTNLINTKGKLEPMNTLERWAAEGKVELVGAARLLLETEAHVQASRKAKSMENVGEPMVWDKSMWDLSNWAAEGGVSFTDVAAVLFPRSKPFELTPNQDNDVMHLMGHGYGNSDIFLTDNTRDFIRDGRSEKLQEQFQLRVMTPAEAVKMLVDKHGWSE